ncbi:Ov4.5 protein [Ovine gammaherpesvirus 2]|uniref:Ov4.5 protein n=1 Tax=Ovine gammaherpesvirus 2 TaxID=10398 RepID=Q2VSN2_9GAMA|nr:Ov4.5 protein [Ovine gammaherpesvirus 2]AAX58044.1 Ov4.5 protein [Ovine gammaherpesvirus 2]
MSTTQYAAIKATGQVKYGSVTTRAPRYASEVMQQALDPPALPSLSQIRPLYKELSGLSRTLRNIIICVLSPHDPVALTRTETVLVDVVRKSIRRNFVTFVSCTLGLPHTRDDGERATSLMEIIEEFYRDGHSSVKKLCTTLAYTCLYLCYLMDNCNVNIEVLSHLLARFYLRHQLAWLVEVGGLSAAVRKAYPKQWCAVTARWLFACGNVSQ